MSAPTPSVSPELKALMRKLKLGRMNDTLPERLALAKTHGLSHMEFLEQLFSDEATRRDADSAGRRARVAHLDPHMVLEAWDDDANVNGQRFLPTGGQKNSPDIAIDLPGYGHGIPHLALGSRGQGLHSLPARRVLETDGFTCGLDHVGVM